MRKVKTANFNYYAHFQLKIPVLPKTNCIKKALNRSVIVTRLTYLFFCTTYYKLDRPCAGAKCLPGLVGRPHGDCIGSL